MKARFGEWLMVTIVDPVVEAVTGVFGIPAVPWGKGTFRAADLLDDPHTAPLAEWLRARHKPLFEQWFHSVRSAAVVALMLEEDLKALQAQHRELVESRTVATINVRESLSKAKADRTTKKKKKKSPIEAFEARVAAKSQAVSFLSVVISFVTFHGVTRLLHIDLRHIALSESFFVAIAFLFASGISLAAKLAVGTLVTRREIRQRKGDKERQELRWYRRLLESPEFWSALIVVTETAFGAPWLVQVLDRAVRNNFFWQLSIVAGAAIGPVINLAMAWALGHDEAELECRREESATTTHDSTEQVDHLKEAQIAMGQAASASERQFEIDRQVKRLERQLRIANLRARFEHRRWRGRVERLWRKYGFLESEQSWSRGNGSVSRRSNSFSQQEGRGPTSLS